MCRRPVLAALVAVVCASVGILAQSPGRSVNMISGITLPDGDPFLQRQNEPSLAVSTRNPLHLLAAANDYRTVDLPGLPADMENGDAWLGVYKSTDGGQTWKTNLLPGYPQDMTPDGVVSPLKQYAAAADATVRAGVNGLFYTSGIAFNREANGKGAVFVARYVDQNNKENGDPIQYLGTSIVASENGVKFLDKPWLAVDIPRGNATCVINGQALPTGVAYLVYTEFNQMGNVARPLAEAPSDDFIDRDHDGIDDRLDGDDDDDDADAGQTPLAGQLMFSSSHDCGASWSVPIPIPAPGSINQGATLAVEPATGKVYVAWRQFAQAAPAQADAIVVTSSTNGGLTFAPPVAIPTKPFDQGTSGTSIRTNAYPTMAIDETGRVYLAWAARGFATARPDPVTGDARIVMTTSTNGTAWTAVRAIDNASTVPGHQIMPALAYGAAKLQIVFYDLREDVSKVFGPYVDDFNLPKRHTLDLRGAQAAPAATPLFTVFSTSPLIPSKLSLRVSEYPRGSRPNSQVIEQLQFNPPDLPLFKQGTVPFLGDYIDIAAAPAFVPTAAGGWTFNTAKTNQAIFHVAWADNRDVRPPADGNWAHYTPPTYTGPLLDPSHPLPACLPGQTGMRNQNIYTARIAPGLAAGSPGNTKPLSANLPRVFVVFAQNTTTQTRTYRMLIANQPPGGRASFSEFPLPPYDAQSPAPLTTIYVTAPPLSLTARSIYITSTNPKARVDVAIDEVPSPGKAPIAGGQAAVVALNPDITNPDITNPDITNGVQTPDITNAEVYNPDITNPDITNPAITTPDITNPDITNARVVNPDITNPGLAGAGDVTNPIVVNNEIANLEISPSDLLNGSITDYTWTVTNEGNTAAAYSTRLLTSNVNIPAGFKLQLIVTQTYKTPVAVGCELKTITQNKLIANVLHPVFDTPGTIGNGDPNADPNNIGFFLAPGQSVKVTLRVVDPIKGDAVTLAADQTIFAGIQPQPINTPNLPPPGQPAPPPAPVVLAPAAPTIAFAVGPSLAFTTQAIAPPIVVSVLDGSNHPLANIPVTITIGHNPGGGTLSGMTTRSTGADGVATFDGLSIDAAGAGYTLIASWGHLVPAISSSFDVIAPLKIDTLALPDSTQGEPYTQTVFASGGTPPYVWSIVDFPAHPEFTLPAGLALITQPNGTGTILGTPLLMQACTFRLRVTDAASRTATQDMCIHVNESLGGVLAATPVGAASIAQALAGDGVAIVAGSVTYTGAAAALGTFSGGFSATGLSSGIILSSGAVANVAPPNNSDSSTLDNQLGGDADLTALAAGPTFDAAVLEFDFTVTDPNATVVKFDYVFASEEFNEFANTQFNDVFGFFVSGPGLPKANLALIPGTNTVVSINNVNGGNPFGAPNAVNAAFFRNNDPNDPGPPTIPIQADGLTTVLSLQATVVPGQTYHMKIAVADAGDHSYDSWVLIKGNSLSAVCKIIAP